MSHDTDRTIAIIGAGPAGLMAGGLLQERGLDVTLFDKGRRPGGRMNTREHGDRRFDHGAQYFTIRSPILRPHLERWREAGVVAEWTGRLVRIGGGAVEPAGEAGRYVGVPGNVALPEHLSRGLDVRSGRRIVSAHRRGPGWSLLDEDGVEATFDAVLVAVPAPQAVPLLAQAPRLQAAAARARMTPCWAGMVAFEQPLPLDFDGAFLDFGPLSWVARNSSKPGRPPGEAWVLHARPEWSESHADLDREEAAGRLLAAFREQFGPLPRVTFRRAHRWGYSLAPEPLGEILWDPDLRMGACGDWCVGGRVEGALLSGLELARRLVAGIGE